MSNPYLTPDAIRLFLLDRSRDDNYLLDAVEYSNEQVDLAAHLAVAKFNTTTPLMEPAYTVGSFPYEYELLLGVCSLLLQSKVINLQRNQLDYSSASGTAVDDKKKITGYLQLAKLMGDEYDNRIKLIKAQVNLERGYGHLGSEYELVNNWSY